MEMLTALSTYQLPLPLNHLHLIISKWFLARATSGNLEQNSEFWYFCSVCFLQSFRKPLLSFVHFNISLKYFHTGLRKIFKEWIKILKNSSEHRTDMSRITLKG